MRTNALIHPFIITLLFITFSISAFAAAPANDNCGTTSTTSPVLTSSTGGTCTTYANGLQDATTSGTGISCGSGSAYDVWFRYVGKGTSLALTLSSLGSQLSASNTYIEILSGSCGSFTSLGCAPASLGLTTPALTTGTTYYIRIYTTVVTTSNGAGKYDFTVCLIDPPANNDCSGSITLTSGSSCTNTSGSLVGATASTGLPSGCESAGTHYDVWYQFVAANTTQTVSLTSLGTNFSNPEIQLYSGSCGSLTSMTCGSTSITGTALTVGSTYYVRVSNIGSNPAVNVGFNICVTSPPSNDECSNPIYLYSNTSCSNTSASLASATPSAAIPLGCAAAGTYYDVWFTFVAANASETIFLSGTTGISSPAIQLFSGSCGSLTSIACGTTSLTATGLSVGSTYFVRVSNIGSPATSTGNFNICVTHPAPVIPSIDYGKSYVNISKNLGGGTIGPGDTLEVRATLVIKSSGLDSLAFLDTLHLGGGVGLVPGSISLRTNEGKVYKSFTDEVTDDEGYFYTSGTDTVIRINFGAGASSTARGKLLNTSKPSVFGSTCIIMATYRVVVYAGYGSNINLGGGKITSKSISTGTFSDLSFSSRNAIVYSSPGLCPNAVAPVNAIGGDFNGTFGSGTAQNRSPSSNVTGYTYSTFTTGAPGDYYYGIANNTSAGGSSFTTTTTWAKPDNSSPTHRVFNLWDITGDHTGASNPVKGNLPCDPGKPVSATNPCGYMLVVNSAYKTDTAFQFTVTNLCPNTYYEISAWLKNICYKCGCDSNGVSSSGAGYIPSDLNDSSGVQPNLTFDINGVDYYTTGNIKYGGLFPSTQTGSDSNNTWVKRGFTYLTGASQTSFTLTIRNNAPGGGGNDWAMDDISLATCLPNMQYSPSLTPAVCGGNSQTIRDTIRSYFSNYQNFKWQKSSDGGTTWSDIAAASGSSSPVWNGSAWEYVTSYTVSPSSTTASNDGDKYRVVVATTSGNLTAADCQVTDGVSQITLDVIDCSFPLNTDILSFNASEKNGRAYLYWTTSREDGPLHYEIEKSRDGNNFVKIGSLSGNNSTSETNRYSFVDSFLSAKNYYRISLTKTNGAKKFSRIIQLNNNIEEFSVSNFTNYFQNSLSFDVYITGDSKIDLMLLNASGYVIKQQTITAYSGVNNFMIPGLDALSPGVYVLQVRKNEKTVILKAIKR